MKELDSARHGIADFFRTIFHDERGATAVEYGLFVAAIAAVIVAIVIGLGDTLNVKLNNVNTKISAIPSP